MHFKDRKIVTIYFGVPGSGKSTFAAYLARRCFRHKYPVFSNFPIIGAYQYSASDLGSVQISDCKLIIDEAGLEFNNRAFKSFTKEQLSFFKLHRHYGVSVDVFSQTFDDMDLKIRSLAQRLYIVRRSLIPFHIVCIPIHKYITIDEEKHQIVDGYRFPPLRFLFCKRIFMPFYWRFFDSYSAPALPVRKFSTYDRK